MIDKTVQLNFFIVDDVFEKPFNANTVNEIVIKKYTLKKISEEIKAS